MNLDNLFSLFLAHKNVNIDTRKVQEGDLFFALKGERFNGNSFAEAALEKGAAYAIMDDPAFYKAGDKRMILVEDSLKTLQELAHHYRSTLDIPVLGLTGSNGKNYD